MLLHVTQFLFMKLMLNVETFLLHSCTFNHNTKMTLENVAPTQPIIVKYFTACPIFQSVLILEVIVQTRVSVEIRSFLTSLSVFRTQRMNTFECLNLLLKLIDILGESRD